MSIFEGKSVSVADEVFGSAGYIDKNGNPVKFGDPNVHVFYSDELKDFEAFKEQTNGTLYQHYNIKEVTEWNQEFVKEHCQQFDFIKHVKQIPDKRNKKGFREEVYYTYKYYDKEYTAKELKKHGGVYITYKVHFETILDLLKYYPYHVYSSYHDSKSKIIYIDSKPWPQREMEEHLKYGNCFGLKDHYDKVLAEHYREICRVIDYKLEERTKIEEIKVNLLTKNEETGNYYFYAQNTIDYNQQVEWFFEDSGILPHWTSPKYVKDNIIEINKLDVESYLKNAINENKVKIKYVRKMTEDEYLKVRIIG